MATKEDPEACTARACCGRTSGSVTGESPTIGGYDLRKNSVNSRSGYMTPLGIPVVPPVYRMYTSSPAGSMRSAGADVACKSS